METKNVPVAPQQTSLKIVCAWCPDFDPKDVSNKDVTHGICPACVAKFEQGSK